MKLISLIAYVDTQDMSIDLIHLEDKSGQTFFFGWKDINIVNPHMFIFDNVSLLDLDGNEINISHIVDCKIIDIGYSCANDNGYIKVKELVVADTDHGKSYKIKNDNGDFIFTKEIERVDGKFIFTKKINDKDLCMQKDTNNKPVNIHIQH